MRPLKRRLRPDNIPNEQRAVRRSAGRTVYLAFLAVFGLAVANYIFGDMFLLRADGLLLRDQSVVATTYVALVKSVEVKEGQTVERDAPLLKLQSLEIIERLADLSQKRAALVAKATEFKIRSERAAQLLPLAERRESESTRVIKQFDELAKDGFVRSVPYAEALRSNYDARHDLVNLATESRVLNDELTALQGALADADAAFRDLQANYAGGVVRSPVSGAVGATIPSTGNVYRPGEPLLSVYSGEPYVLLYLPRRYLFPIYVGMKLHISDGRQSANGVVAEILPLTAMLPKEFQNTFQPQDRNQLAKIRLEAGASFPLHQKVTVSRPYI